MQNTMLDSIVSSNSQELPNASSALKLFENQQFRVRVIMRCSDPWFVAKDACDCLELTNVSKACQTLDEDEKGITKVYTLGGSQDMMLISESGLYTLITRRKIASPSQMFRILGTILQRSLISQIASRLSSDFSDSCS